MRFIPRRAYSPRIFRFYIIQHKKTAAGERRMDASRRFQVLLVTARAYATKFLTSSIDAGFAERAIVPFFISMIAGSSAMPSFSTILPFL